MALIFVWLFPIPLSFKLAISLVALSSWTYHVEWEFNKQIGETKGHWAIWFVEYRHRTIMASDLDRIIIDHIEGGGFIAYRMILQMKSGKHHTIARRGTFALVKDIYNHVRPYVPPSVSYEDKASQGL